MNKTLLCIIVVFMAPIAFVFLIVPVFDRVPVINESTKTCLVTGASSGIGLEISRDMIKRGWSVVGVARREEVLKDVLVRLGSSFIPYVCDVSDVGQVAATSQEIKRQGLRPTLFFLNTGTGNVEEKYEPFVQEHKKIFNTNYFGTVAWVEEWVAEVKKYGGGTFVSTSSVSSLFAMPGSAGYSASKSALNACFQSFRLQYRRDGIGFVLVLPGPVKTGMLKVKKPMPFTHSPANEAKYIIKQVFNREKQIEPSWFYSFVMRMFSWLPDALLERLLISKG